MLISYFQFWVHLTFLLKGVRSLVVSGGSTWEDRPLTSTIRNICNLRCVNVSVWVQLSKFLRLNYKSLYYCVNYMTNETNTFRSLFTKTVRRYKFKKKNQFSFEFEEITPYLNIDSYVLISYFQFWGVAIVINTYYNQLFNSHHSPHSSLSF